MRKLTRQTRLARKMESVHSSLEMKARSTSTISRCCIHDVRALSSSLFFIADFGSVYSAFLCLYFTQ